VTQLPPLVHVIVIALNGKRNLEYCLPALGRTAYPNYQIILADNSFVNDAPE
jgi:glycosyltransferase involved in cell wall biosynthesis